MLSRCILTDEIAAVNEGGVDFDGIAGLGTEIRVGLDEGRNDQWS